MSKTILIAGASGVNGLNTAKHFMQATDWDVVTLTQSKDAPVKGAKHLAVNLLKKSEIKAVKGDLAKVDVIFYAALKPADDPSTEADENARMFDNLLSETLKLAGTPPHVIFLQGGKVYGAHLGVYKTPAREEDSRHFPPNLYFRHEDIARQYEADAGLMWTALRPDIVIGHSIGSAMNMGNLIGVYGSLCRELEVAMQFPGTAAAYDVLVNVTDAGIVAEAVMWAITEEQTGAFNITNGDYFRWKHLWPALGDFFDVDIGEPQPISLETRLAAVDKTWTKMAKRDKLAEASLERLATGGFGDFIFHVEADAVFDTTKARQSGFTAMNRRSDESILNHLQQMRDKKLIP